MPDPRTLTLSPNAAAVELRLQGDALVTTVSGRWALDGAAPLFAPLADAALAAADSAGAAPDAPDAPDAPRMPIKRIGFDAATLDAWDSSLLVFLRQGQAYGAAHDCAVDTTGLPTRITTLLALAGVVPERIVDGPTSAPSLVARIGAGGIAAFDATRSGLTFVGEVARGFTRLFTGRTRMQWRAFWVVVQSNSSGALPIVTLIAMLVGVIIAFLGVVVLERFGASYYVSYLVGYGMLREMGALMTGIIIAGRTGAGFAAELGSMKITEELDAYATLGIAPVDHLVLPRVLGLFVTLPLLVVYADVVGIGGGMVVATSSSTVTATQFLTGMREAVSLSDAVLGVVKATLFGGIIGLAGCFHGLRTGTDASAVGRSATSAVVLGITLIILCNAVVDWLAALWHI